MAKRKAKKRSGGGARRQTRATDPYQIDGLIGTVLKGGRELLEVEDPFDAEHWGSMVLGLFYKMPVPFEVSQEVERSLLPRLVQGAERMRNRAGLAVLCALASITGEPAARESCWAVLFPVAREPPHQHRPPRACV